MVMVLIGSEIFQSLSVKVLSSLSLFPVFGPSHTIPGKAGKAKLSQTILNYGNTSFGNGQGKSPNRDMV